MKNHPKDAVESLELKLNANLVELLRLLAQQNGKPLEFYISTALGEHVEQNLGFTMLPPASDKPQ